MTQTTWSHLPNAKHIDRIIADLGKNTGVWTAAWDAEWYAAWNAASADARTAARTDAWNATRNATRTDAWNDAWDDAWNAAWNAARNAARNAAASGAILALIAYDDCAYLLDEKPEHVQMLALLGNEKAILLYSACVALQQKEREIE